jgi:uncharacterized protein YkwD
MNPGDLMRRPALTIRTSVLALLGLLVGGFAVFAPGASAASYTTSGYASRLLSLVNDARTSHGLPALRTASGTTTVAAGWTSHLASAQGLSHNPDLRHQIETHGSPDWGIYGENVGQGYSLDPEGLFRAYMQSPEHRANILEGSYRYVGVAVVFTGKTAWNTFDFVDTYGTPTAAKQPAPKPVTHHRTQATKPQAQPAPKPAPSAKPATAPAQHADTRRPQHRTHSAAGHRVTQHKADAHRSQHVKVQGLTGKAATPTPIREVVATATASVTPLSGLPTNRSSRAVLVALAVLALSAAARRWTLTVTTR